jgi:hypothetical protein
MRYKPIWIFAVCFGLSCLVALSGGCKCKCQSLTLDQHDAVGAFLSLNRNPFGASMTPEVEPARIRARRGEEIVWVIRNPSPQDVEIKLGLVVDPGTSADIKEQVFSNLGGKATIPGNCGIGWLRAQLQSGGFAYVDSCHGRTFNYFFDIFAQEDSVRVGCLYDPELVVEGEP